MNTRRWRAPFALLLTVGCSASSSGPSDAGGANAGPALCTIMDNLHCGPGSSDVICPPNFTPPAGTIAPCTLQAYSPPNSEYCCPFEPPPPPCTATTGAGCGGDAGGAVEYTCMADASPEASPSDTCVAHPASAGGSVAYCCFDPTSQCSSATVAGCGGPGQEGFTCDGGVSPSQLDPGLDCALQGSLDGGAAMYCCSTQCTTSYLDCGSGATAYRCATGAMPPAGEGSSCGAFGSSTPDTVDYCCSTGPCAPGVVPYGYPGCSEYPASVYTCSGSARPDQLDSTLWCEPTTGGSGGQSLYCCGTASCSQGTNTNWSCDFTTQTGYLCSGSATPPAGTSCGPRMSITNIDSYFCCNQ